MGCSVLVSQLFGAKRYGELKSAVSTACIFSGILCLCLMAFTFFGGEMLLRFIKTPEDIFADSTIYLDIYVYGLPFVFFYILQPEFFPAWGIPEHRFCFWQLPLYLIFLWTSYLSSGSFTWGYQEWPEWHGQPFSARASAASWQ